MFGKHWIKGRDNSTFLRASQVVPVVEKKKKKSACKCWRFKKWGFNPWVRKILWSRKWQPTPVVILPGKSHGQRRLVVYSPWLPKKSDMTEYARTRARTHTHPHPEFLGQDFSDLTLVNCFMNLQKQDAVPLFTSCIWYSFLELL